MNYRVWAVRNPPREATYHPVSTPQEGASVILDLIWHDLLDSTVSCNAFGLEVFEDDEWHEWYDAESGNSVDYLVKALDQ